MKSLKYLSITLIFFFLSCGVKSVTISDSSIELEVGETYTLTADVEMSGSADEEAVNWLSDDESIATVASGVIKGVAKGTTTITAEAGNKDDTCEVIVNSTTLKIVNNASFAIDLISWFDNEGKTYYFGDDQVWDSVLSKYVSGISAGSSSKRYVKPGTSYVYFYFTTGGSKYRTISLVTVVKNQDAVFTFTGETMVTTASAPILSSPSFINNLDNGKTLLEIDKISIFNVEDRANELGTMFNPCVQWSSATS